MASPRPSAVRRGIGSNDLSADARHYTTFALGEISRLMNASEDDKLRFTCAKYLLEQGWGRPGLRPTAIEADAGDPELAARLTALLDIIQDGKAVRAQRALPPPVTN